MGTPAVLRAAGALHFGHRNHHAPQRLGTTDVLRGAKLSTIPALHH